MKKPHQIAELSSEPHHGALALVILAAGHGSRMRSQVPKPLHPVAGIPMIEHVLRAGKIAHPSRTVLVVGESTSDLAAQLGWMSPVVSVVQNPPRGTGDAVRCALPVLRDVQWVLVLYADHPLLTTSAIEHLVLGAQRTNARVTILTCLMPEAAGYGRVARDDQDRPVKVIERWDDDPNLRRGLTEINSGMMVIDAEWAQSALHRLSASKVSGEFYLTDLIALAVEDGPKDNADWPVAAVRAAPEVAMGVDEPGQLARADAVIRDRIRARHLESGVQMIGADTIFIDEDVDIGAGTTISPFTIIRQGSSIGQRCVIGPNAVLERVRIGDDVTVQSSTLTDVSVASGSDVGPYAHLRGQSEIGPSVHIGNFVEINRSVVEEGVKIGHVSYLGDARVGADTNVGAGAITCNFDGKNKNRTTVGRSVFIGSDTMLVAPVTIGDGAVTGAGSVVTHDVPPGVTVMGVPARPRPADEASESGKEERNR